VDAAFIKKELTEVVPSYIPGDVRQIAASTHEDIVCLLTGTNKLYVYNYDHQGQQRTQFSWSTFTFSCDKIYSIVFIDSVLYMVVKRPEGLFIEKINLTSGLKDSNVNYVVSLDRRAAFPVSDDGSSHEDVNYSAVTGKTTVTLPYTPSSGVETLLTNQLGYIHNGSLDGNTITVNGDITEEDLWAGERFTMKYEFTQPTMKRRDRTNQTVEQALGRHQLRYGTILYRDSSYFTVGVTPDYGTTSTYTFTGKTLGSNTAKLGSSVLNSGTFRFPVFSKSDRVSIVIENDSPFPSKLISAEFEALYVSRQRARY